MKSLLLILVMWLSFSKTNESTFQQSNVIKKNEKLTTQQISYLKQWGIVIPIDKNCVNKYIKTNKGLELQKSYVVYNDKDKKDGFINVSSIYYQVVFYENNSFVFFSESSGSALTEDCIIDLTNKIKQKQYYSTAVGGTSSDLEYYNIYNIEIKASKIPQNIIEKLKRLSGKMESIFNEFY